jgi:hypothetical protein
MSALVKFETAKSALAEARTVDEVKDIRDKAEAMRAYARMANDVQLELDAAELRLRAERRLGVMLAAEKASGRLPSGRPKKYSDSEYLSLHDLGVDPKLSSRSQNISTIPKPMFEAAIAKMCERIAAPDSAPPPLPKVRHGGVMQCHFDVQPPDAPASGTNADAQLRILTGDQIIPVPLNGLERDCTKQYVAPACAHLPYRPVPFSVAQPIIN